MTNFFTQIITILCILFISTDASGTIVIRIFSPKTVLVEPTVCANFECPAPDELSMTRKVQGESTLHFGTGHYHGEARERIDLHLKVMEPSTNEVIAIEHFRPFADNKWNQANPLILTTSQGFNVSIRLLNKCDDFYHGKRCGRYCIPSPNRHWECSDEGERQCAAGWTGVDCSNPICPGGCSGRGRCVSPGKCSCIEGFNGTQCDQCIPRAGCLHGGCLNGIPNTCKCKDGFIGDKCDIDINICSTQKPCVNGGRCSIDSSSGNGFKCDCPFAFLGVRCETPLAKVKCVSADHVCQNGGACFSVDDKTIQCKCPKGFTGKFCEFGVHKDCSTMKCSKTAECHMAGDMPMCLEKGSRNEEEHVEIKKKSTERREMKEPVGGLENKSSMIFLGLFCIIGLILSMFLIYSRFINKRRTIASPSSAPASPLSKSTTSSPVYKVCIIDAENGNPTNSSDSEPDHCLHRHSPPPAYSSPVMPRIYKSIPMEEDSSSFRV